MKKELLIGNTPLIKINFKFLGQKKYLYAKLEYYSFTGSIKDRIALYILTEAKKKGVLKECQPIVEATSGNTGISFAALGTLNHHPVHIFMPDWVSLERIQIMKLYGAKVHLVSKEEGGFLEAIRRADLFAKEIGGYRPDQFHNYDNVLAHYHTTGLEIIESIPHIAGVVSGIGTGGTLMGIAKRVKEVFPDSKIVALEPKQLPVLTKGITEGSHKIEGIGDEFVPEIVDLSMIDQVTEIDDMDAINMARKLAQKLGLGVGISSGANFLAAALEKENDFVTVFADDFKKYLSTDLGKEIDSNPDFISNQITLLDFEII